MSSSQAREIIVIKRGNHGEEAHHGGAWKIAFADFMTAMMALFLVLWLVNAANEETRKAVASYFNPVKLVEKNKSKKGLEDQKGGATSIDDTGGLPTDESTKDKETRQQEEKKFFDDPFAALAEISDKKTNRAIALAKGQGGGSGEESPSSPFPDPFGPDFAGQAETLGDLTQPGPIEMAPAEAMAPASGPVEKTREQADATEQVDAAMDGQESAAAEKKVMAAVKDGTVAEGQTEHARAKPAPDLRQDADTQAGLEAKKIADAKANADTKKAADAREKRIDAETRKVHAELVDKLKTETELTSKMRKGLEVKAVDDGVLISVTDQLGFSMFEIGSAVPLKQTVLAMDGIAKVLAKQKGHLRVYGHTDARPFSTPDDDNWRLSAARAHAAYFMLVRGGVKEDRFSQIAGYADRKLKVPEHPNADVNRRIEILLEVQ